MAMLGKTNIEIMAILDVKVANSFVKEIYFYLSTSGLTCLDKCANVSFPED